MERVRKFLMSYGAWVSLAAVCCALFLVVTLHARAFSEVLTIAFLDVGQGDSIYIESPTGVQVLVDAGKDAAVLRALGKVLPPFDRSIDMVIATHPDGDHVGGFPEILRRFDVDAVVYQEMHHDAPAADAFEQALIAWRLRRDGRVGWEPHRGDVYDLGGGVYLTILFPDRKEENGDTNDASIVALVQYGDTRVLLTGDAPAHVEEYLASIDADALDVAILKLGHHGSNTSSSASFLAQTSPEVAIISRGCDNQYGHPHRDVTERLAHFSIPALDTCDEGTIRFVSDGKVFQRK